MKRLPRPESAIEAEASRWKVPLEMFVGDSTMETENDCFCIDGPAVWPEQRSHGVHVIAQERMAGNAPNFILTVWQLLYPLGLSEVIKGFNVLI